MRRVFLAGEGPNEIGRWSRHPSYQTAQDVGVLEALLRKSVEAGWSVCGGMQWREIPKFRAGDHRSAEARNVLGVALRAREAGCDALVFSRDRDGILTREADIESGLQSVAKLLGVPTAGGMAIENVDAWVMACLGMARSEGKKNAKAVLETEHGIATTNAKVVAIEQADLEALPVDAHSLKLWLNRVRALLSIESTNR